MARQYEFRPAKAAQRRMVIDTCRRLTAIAPLDEYQYVGFGGLEFIDFSQFHLALGVQDMTSIEIEAQDEARCEFNKPYESVRLLIGDSRDRLTDVDWTKLAIVWLDYTDQLTTRILADIEYTIRAATPGSMLIVTVNGGVSSTIADRLPNLRAKLGERVDASLNAGNMKGWGAAREQRRIMQQEAAHIGRDAHGAPIQQLFNFEYADGSKMLTWGGLISSKSLDRLAELCRFDDLPFVRREDAEPMEVRVPFLTDREMASIEHRMVGLPDLPDLVGVERADIAYFRSVYRWRVGTR